MSYLLHTLNSKNSLCVLSLCSYLKVKTKNIIIFAYYIVYKLKTLKQWDMKIDQIDSLKQSKFV